MDQYFMLTNVDRRECFQLGKLGPAIYNGKSPLLLIIRLGAPLAHSRTGSWAGHRIITVGDYMRDCPLGMLTKAEEEEIQRYADQFVQDDHRFTFYNFASQTFKTDSVFPRYSLTVPDTMVLRNLSKRIYVHEKEFRRYLHEKKQREGIRGGLDFTLNQLILINTAWSNDPSCAMTSLFEIIPGPWAGDRFDYVAFQTLKSEGDVGSWQDVTEEQAERAFQIVEAEL